MAQEIERQPLARFSNENVAVLVAVSALSKAIDPSGRLNREAIETMRAAADLARVGAPMREVVLAVADFMEAGHG